MTHRFRYKIILVLLIIAVAAFFRLNNLKSARPGLYPDEAMNGSNAIVANQTRDYNVFYSENNGREGLFINLQALSIKQFGNQPWALRGVSAVIGILTVLGLYFLARELFGWQIGAISSFLLAISFWHVNFSRIGFRAIMVPFILVYVFYFLWRGLRRSHFQDFFWAGIFMGLGFYTYTSFRAAPIILILILANYWLFIKKDYSRTEYLHARNRLLAGFAMLFLVTFFVALPIGVYLLKNPGQFMTQGHLSVFGQEEPLRELAQSVVRTLGMFTFSGDYNPRHNIPGAPMLGWPIAILFGLGFIKELVHWLRRKHGHLSPVHTLLFVWFFAALLPGFLSTQAPHALRAVGVIPVAMIFAARGLWWIFHSLEDWEAVSRPWDKNKRYFLGPIVALVALLGAFGIYEYNRYFKVWASSPETKSAFSEEYSKIAGKINALPDSTKKYVIVKSGEIEAYGLPIKAQTVMFLTNTVTPADQRAKNLIYLTDIRAKTFRFDSKGVIFEIK
ncbi:MAG: hypothetical protein A3A26_01710 [Candidatus Zambryskibacteria bacterium RIFCSPLOWO2_01_FULL_47_14]|uniref:Glycosyltransferase RgtA/B/C/D-like domain-containing protein n=2 Tax=Parcubacteria group TaxID=1794811 RepID=A0A1G2U7K1_9BACT|nr:MAG: hypothetical protein UY36_C0021G0007 [Parcubacteria group bacterium GW2011_GWA1_49_11]OGN06179.1 MAG: hypothetical protein A2669_02615 [Candidatus Yanofskybacteria bacterium RIFCSPHIGHO2_01_FULL_48_25b]OHB05454.1 MAG: hypothetical protein A3A26_01710 [Candidatus Zambryskibacteria bacterium RIFCSPLOWO2_01_FULL_47_14]